MGAIIGFDENTIFTTNGEWEDVVADVIVVARSLAQNEAEQGFVASMEGAQRHGFFSGYCPNFHDLCPSREAKIFWASCFLELARWLCEGKMRHRFAWSPTRRVFIAYWCGDVLKRLLHREPGTFELNDHDSILYSKVFEVRTDSDAVHKIEQEEWQRRLAEADERGQFTAELNEHGWAQCPFCERSLSPEYPASWDGERHRVCLSRVQLVHKAGSPEAGRAVKPASKPYWHRD